MVAEGHMLGDAPPVLGEPAAQLSNVQTVCHFCGEGLRGPDGKAGCWSKAQAQSCHYYANTLRGAWRA